MIKVQIHATKNVPFLPCKIYVSLKGDLIGDRPRRARGCAFSVLALVSTSRHDASESFIVGYK